MMSQDDEEITCLTCVWGPEHHPVECNKISQCRDASTMRWRHYQRFEEEK